MDSGISGCFWKLSTVWQAEWCLGSEQQLSRIAMRAKCCWKGPYHFWHIRGRGKYASMGRNVTADPVDWSGSEPEKEQKRREEINY